MIYPQLLILSHNFYLCQWLITLHSSFHIILFPITLSSAWKSHRQLILSKSKITHFKHSFSTVVSLQSVLSHSTAILYFVQSKNLKEVLPSSLSLIPHIQSTRKSCQFNLENRIGPLIFPSLPPLFQPPQCLLISLRIPPNWPNAYHCFVEIPAKILFKAHSTSIEGLQCSALIPHFLSGLASFIFSYCFSSCCNISYCEN